MGGPSADCHFAVGVVAYSDDVAAALKSWRNAHDVAQTDLADQMGVVPSVLSDYESGRRENPGIDFVARYVEAVEEVAAPESDVSDEDATDGPPYSLRSGSSPRGHAPNGLRPDIRESVEALLSGFKRD